MGNEAVADDRSPAGDDREDARGQARFQGQISDESPYGLRVQFDGLPAVAGLSAAVCWDTWFNINLAIPPSQQGTVTVNVDDWWGVAADEVFAIVRPV